MSVLSRLEAVQRTDTSFREVVASELHNLVDVVSTAVLLELKRLARSEPGLRDWAGGVTAIIGEFMPVSSCALVVMVDDLPPVVSGFGQLGRLGIETMEASLGQFSIDLDAWPTRREIGDLTNVLARSISLGGAVVARAVIAPSGSTAAAAALDSLLVAILDTIEADLPAVIDRERSARSEASDRARVVAAQVISLDDAQRLRDLADVLCLLPAAVGCSIAASSVLAIEPVRVQVGLVHTAHAAVRRITVERGTVEVAVHTDGYAARTPDTVTDEASAAGDVLDDVMASIATAARSIEAERAAMVASDLGGETQLRMVIDHALGSLGGLDRTLMVSVVALADDPQRTPERTTVRLTEMGRSLQAGRAPVSVGRLEQFVAVVCFAIDEIEARALLMDLSAAVKQALRPKGLAPRVDNASIAMALAPAHGYDADSLFTHALAQLAAVDN
jgi:hypothetical protein